MTVQHMVWLKTPVGVSDAEMAELMEKILQLKSIHAVTDIIAGKNYKDTRHDYEYGVIMTYTDKAAQRRYIDHPKHAELRDQIKQMGIGMMALDFEH